MVWKWASSVPILLLVLAAPDCIAQATDTVPVTLTFPDARNLPLDKVQFHGLAFVDDSVFSHDPYGPRIQHTVGALIPTGDRYFLEMTLFKRMHDWSQDVSFARESSCIDQAGETFMEGKVERIICSVVENGEQGQRLTCMAVYDQLGQVPDNYCTGTVWCRKCNEVKVCGSNPNCE